MGAVGIRYKKTQVVITK